VSSLLAKRFDCPGKKGEDERLKFVLVLLYCEWICGNQRSILITTPLMEVAYDVLIQQQEKENSNLNDNIRAWILITM
jgi:hypothetical protein